MFFLRKLKMIYLVFKNAMDPQPKYVFEMSNTAAKMSSPADVATLMNEVYGRHPNLEVLLNSGKDSFETDLQKLHALPAGTLGHIYAEHMLENNLDPKFYVGSKFSDQDVAGRKWEYFRVYSLQSHDVWHVLAGYKTNYLGEIGIFSFLFGQVSVSLYLLITASIAMHPIFGRKRQDSLQAFQNISDGFRMGRAAKSCLGVDWDLHWHRDINDVRRDLNIILPA